MAALSAPDLTALADGNPGKRHPNVDKVPLSAPDLTKVTNDYPGACLPDALPSIAIIADGIYACVEQFKTMLALQHVTLLPVATMIMTEGKANAAIAAMNMTGASYLRLANALINAGTDAIFASVVGWANPLIKCLLREHTVGMDCLCWECASHILWECAEPCKDVTSPAPMTIAAVAQP